MILIYIIFTVVIYLLGSAVGYTQGLRTTEREYKNIVDSKDARLCIIKDDLDGTKEAYAKLVKKYHAALRKANEKYIEQVMKWRKSQVRKRGWEYTSSLSMGERYILGLYREEKE